MQRLDCSFEGHHRAPKRRKWAQTSLFELSDWLDDQELRYVNRTNTSTIPGRNGVTPGNGRVYASLGLGECRTCLNILIDKNCSIHVKFD